MVLVLLHRHHIRVCPKPVADTRSHEPETCTVYERRDSLRIKRETLRPRIILTFLLLVIATACLERAQGAFVEEAPVSCTEMNHHEFSSSGSVPLYALNSR